MGKIVSVALGTRSNPARYKQGGSARLINCYAEDAGGEAKVPWPIYACDGLQGFAVLPDANGGVRAAIEVDGVYYCVAGTRAYKVQSNGIVTLIASMNIDATSHVSMTRNRRTDPDITISCGGLMFNIRAGVLSQVTDADLLAPTSHSFVDGYLVVGTANNTWQIGAIDDATAWDPLDYTRADANPDAVVCVSAMQSQAVIFGEVSTEFWRNTGGADFPFDRVTSVDIGLIAPGSVQAVEQTLAFVAHDRTVRMFAGYEAVRISTNAVERAIEDLADRSMIKSSTWVKDGHTFYAITSADWTWVYDTVTKLWHERASYGAKNWLASTVTAFAGKLIVGDADEGKLYEMSADFFDEAGTPLVSTVVMPSVHAFPNPLIFNAMYIDVQTGVGTGQGATQDVDPELMVEWSDDGGATFAGQRVLKLGQQGKATTRVRTFRLGRSGEDGRVFRISCSARVARALYGVSVDIEKAVA
jgi:hypothetical protein